MIGIEVNPARIEVVERGEEIARVHYHGVEFEVRAWSERIIYDCSSGRMEEARLKQRASLEDMAEDIAGQITARIALKVEAGREVRI